MRALTAPEDARRVRATLISIRQSINFAAREMQGPTHNRLAESIEKLEQAIVDFSPVSELVRLHRNTNSYMEELTDDLRQLINDTKFIDTAKVIPYQPYRDIEERGRGLLGLWVRQRSSKPLFISEHMSVVGAISSLMSWLQGDAPTDRQETKLSEFNRLQRLLPPQKIAPVQFEIAHGRLSLLKTLEIAPSEHRESVDAARNELLAGGERILKELENSNCDRRLVETVQYLQTQITEESNVVRIGLSNIRCQLMCSAFGEELPPAVASMLQAHTLSVEMFVAQFPDWSRFVEKRCRRTT